MNLSNKFIVFLLGLAVGLLIGAGFFIFKIDDYISKLELFKSAPDTIITIADNKGDDKPKNIQHTNQVTVKQDRKKDDSLTRMANDSTSGRLPVNLPDSIGTDSGKTGLVNNENIIVKKDELLSAKTIDVTTLIAGENKNPKDSLLQKESGVRDDSKNQLTAYQVEFWQSPINYKGYKMLKNKIVLFGITQADNLKLYRIEDALYMKQQQNVYRLAFTGDFRQFENVKDQSVLAKIK